MLRNLYVKNFILIDELNLEFNDGYSVFTGETGAGKSLLVDALMVLSGSRFSPSFIQTGADKSLIEATFEIDKTKETSDFLKNAGFELDDDILIISREIVKDGKSTSRLNNRITTLGFIKELMVRYLDINNQNDSQYLLNNSFHLSLLDAYVNDEILKQKVYDRYHEYKKLKDELNLVLSDKYNENDLEFLNFEKKEIDDLSLEPNEYEELIKKQRDMANFEKDSESINSAMNLLEKSDSENIYEAAKSLKNVDSESMKSLSEKLFDIYYQLDDRRNDLQEYISNIDFDETAFNELQSRIYYVEKVLRKYGGSYSKMSEHYSEIENKINLINNRQNYIDSHEKAIKASYQAFEEEAIRLHNKRKKGSEELKVAVERELSDLHLENSTFEVYFQDTANENGIDKIEFLISMNVGENPRPLNKVASGGELSRLLLGLKTVFINLQSIDTIIFDEIDAGVSGSVAFSIGHKMKLISNSTQVLSVTHLAPVAAFADSHYRVSKIEKNGHTNTIIKKLDNNEIIEELASISTGTISNESKEAAKELLNRAKAV